MGKKIDVSGKKSKIVKRLSQYGYNDCEVIRSYFEDYHIFVKDKSGEVHRVGTAVRCKDDTFNVGRLNIKLLESIKVN